MGIGYYEAPNYRPKKYDWKHEISMGIQIHVFKAFNA
jgi:hypothetical protein